MPIQRIERLVDEGDVEIGIRLHGAGSNNSGIAEVLYADVAGNPDPAIWNTAKLSNFESLMQDKIDVRIKLNDPSLSEDPVGSTDPGREDFFYEGGDLVSRSVIFSKASFEAPRMSFEIRRADTNKPAP